MSTPSRRKEMDVMKLMNSDHKVEMIDDGIHDFFVYFHGPKNSPYEGGVWKVRVELPYDYPYSSPFISFMNKIFHPNIDENSGTVCMDVINQTWTPMFDLANVFELFLPQLLLFPNEKDPLNTEASNLIGQNMGLYELKVKDYCEKYAKPEDVGMEPENKSNDEKKSEDENDSNENDSNDDDKPN